MNDKKPYREIHLLMDVQQGKPIFKPVDELSSNDPLRRKIKNEELAELSIPCHTDDTVYALVVYVINKANHQIAMSEMGMVEPVKFKLVEQFQKYASNPFDRMVDADDSE